MRTTAVKCLLDTLDNQGIRHSDTDSTALATNLETLLDQARQAWPNVNYDEESFIAHIADRLPEGVAPSQALTEIRGEDLYLAWACGRRDRAALSAFSKSFDNLVSATLNRLAKPGVDVDEAKGLQEAVVPLVGLDADSVDPTD